MKKSLYLFNALLIFVLLTACTSVGAKSQDKFDELMALSKKIIEQESWVNSCIPGCAFTSNRPDEKTYWVDMGFKPGITAKTYKPITEKYIKEFRKITGKVSINPCVSWEFTKDISTIANKTKKAKDEALTKEAMSKVNLIQKNFNEKKYDIEYISTSYRLIIQKNTAKIIYMLYAPIDTKQATADLVNSAL
ncbi:MAG: hypothetical protein CR988_06260 [Treponema sp.]|nr:MAG: hypothetical protein CR988_06260 [Treponema sp.]